MRICPQCKKKYDDTWKICFNCSVDLVDPASSNQNTRDFQNARSEISSVRAEITKLTERLNRLEYGLSDNVGVAQKEPEPSRQKQVEKEPRRPIFQEEKPKAPPQPRKSITENFEQMLGEKWFNKLGILAVVIGVALLVGYSFRYLGPAGKIGIGFMFGIGMLVFGHFIEKKKDFSIYGKGLIAGGWAISYFTIFAMYHIPAVRLIQSPLLGMALLLGVSAVTIVDIYRYKSQVATAFSYLLMFITLMITPVSLYTMAAAVPVALSLIFFMYKREWLEFGLYGMVMTYVTYMAWFGIAQKVNKTAMTTEQFFAAAAFLILYWAIFVISTLLIEKNEKKTLHISAIDLDVGFKDLVHVINTVVASFIGASLLNFGFMKYLQPALLIACGLYLALTVFTYLKKARSLCLISSTASVLFAAIYLSVRYSGYPLTVSYILLAQLVLLAGILLKESYWRLFAFAGLVIIIGKLLIADSFIVKNAALASHLSTRTFLFAFAFVIYLVNHRLYVRLDAAKKLLAVEKDCPNIICYIHSCSQHNFSNFNT